MFWFLFHRFLQTGPNPGRFFGQKRPKYTFLTWKEPKHVFKLKRGPIFKLKRSPNTRFKLKMAQIHVFKLKTAQIHDFKLKKLQIHIFKLKRAQIHVFNVIFKFYALWYLCNNKNPTHKGSQSKFYFLWQKRKPTIQKNLV